jgi:hypothetical protein
MKIIGGQFDLGDVPPEVKKLLESLEGKKEVVTKIVPMKPAWIKELKRILAEKDKCAEIKKKAKEDSDKLWAMVRLDLNNFSTSMRFDETNTKVEYIQDEEDAKKAPGIKSPFSEV